MEDEVPKSLPEEFILDLYEKYKEAVEEGDDGENSYFLIDVIALILKCIVMGAVKHRMKKDKEPNGVRVV